MMNYKNTTRLDTICLPTDISDFSQITEDFNCCLPNGMPPIEEIIDDKIAIQIVDKKIVNSPIGTSAEGYVLSGKTLIVIVDIKITYQYLSTVNTSIVHSFNSIYSTIVPISLNKNINDSFEVNPNVFIEDLYYNLESDENVFTNVTFLVTAEQFIGGC